MRHFLALIVLLFCSTAFGQQTLKVAVFPSTPFAMQENGQWTGFDIDLWNAVAAKNGWKTEFVAVPEFSDLFSQIKSGAVDAAVSNIAITADREEFLDFSHSYMETGLGIVVDNSDPKGILATVQSFWLTYKPVIKKIAITFAIYIGFVMLTGLILYVLDLGESSGIADKFPKGWWDAAWCAMPAPQLTGSEILFRRLIEGESLRLSSSSAVSSASAL